MIDVTYSGWVAVFAIVQIAGFATLFFYTRKRINDLAEMITPVPKRTALSESILNVKEQNMVDSRAIAALIKK